MIRSSNTSNSNRNSSSPTRTAATAVTAATPGLRKLETVFLFLIGIFLSISIFVNVIHEFDIQATIEHKIQHGFQHPQFQGVTFSSINNSSGSGSGSGSSTQRIKPIFHEEEKQDQTDQKEEKPENEHESQTMKNIDNFIITHSDNIDSGITKTTDSSTSIQRKPKHNHELGGLSCDKYNGPSDEIAQEMIYWRDIPSDSLYESPFKRKSYQSKDKTSNVQYMTFEPDGGGWNNIRMAMETVVVLAHAMGRTLVLPPAQGMYLLRKNRGKQQTDFSFADFFHLESLNNEHSGIDIISTEEFLLREAMTGNMRNKTSGEISFPPNNRTNWDGQDVKPLKEWLRQVTLTPLWSPSKCLAAFPESGDPKDAQALHDMVNKIIEEGRINIDQQYKDHPTPVNASAIDRMKEALAGRHELCIYDHEMQAAPVIHFMCYHKMRVRLLTHFYSFVFFEDWRQQLWTNRFVRDHLRYLDELQCAAARLVNKLHSIARENGEPNGYFDTFHVRRGDFQYKDTRLDAVELYEEGKSYVPENATLYIATDERNKDFFNVFKDHYNVYFLDDFKDLFNGLNTNYYGMLDQLIASRGRTFVGTYYSTFTGYINRMRGYSSTKMNLEGSKEGVINSYYFVPKGRKEAMKHYSAVKGPYFAREFPTSWYNIDMDVSSHR